MAGIPPAPLFPRPPLPSIFISSKGGENRWPPSPRAQPAQPKVFFGCQRRTPALRGRLEGVSWQGRVGWWGGDPPAQAPSLRKHRGVAYDLLQNECTREGRRGDTMGNGIPPMGPNTSPLPPCQPQHKSMPCPLRSCETGISICSGCPLYTTTARITAVPEPTTPPPNVDGPGQVQPNKPKGQLQPQGRRGGGQVQINRRRGGGNGSGRGVRPTASGSNLNNSTNLCAVVWGGAGPGTPWRGHNPEAEEKLQRDARVPTGSAPPPEDPGGGAVPRGFRILSVVTLPGSPLNRQSDSRGATTMLVGGIFF